MTTIHELGQYFTTDSTLKQKVVEFILNKPKVILEPSVGQGDLVKAVHDNKQDIQFDMYEIDSTIQLLEHIPTNVIYGDFLQQNIKKNYTTIIGNPPFVRTQNGNLYIDFVEKCFELLENNGELIFIVPSMFFKLTSAAKLLDKMMNTGAFTHIYHPNNEKLFKKASIDVIIFRYCKNNKLKKKVLYNDNQLNIINNDGLITFNKNEDITAYSFKDYFDVHVGLVTGRESVYKNDELGNIKVLNGKDKINNYIFIEKFPCNNEKINNYLLEHKNELISRKIKKFNEKNWFEWGAPRNIKKMIANKGKSCIYINTLTREDNVAFMGKVQYFGGGLLILIPKKSCDLQKVTNYLNSERFKKNFIFSGRFKIGHRQLSNSLFSI